MREQVRRRALAPAETAAASLDTQLSAMGGYMNLFDDWLPAPLATPILHITASEALSGQPMTPELDRLRLAPGSHTTVSLPGNHFTLLSQHAPGCVEVLGDWLGKVC